MYLNNVVILELSDALQLSVDIKQENRTENEHLKCRIRGKKRVKTKY